MNIVEFIKQIFTKPTPVKPTPVKPTPAKPTPAKPTPVKPTPAKPTPAKPTPAKPTPVKPTLVKTISEKMVELATKEVGVREVGSTNCGPRVNEYKAATWLDPKKPWPWCAAFICWLVREAMVGGKYSFKRPQTAGAWDFENWATKQKSGVNLKKPHSSDIKPGDIVVFTFSHIGLATSTPNKRGYVKTIEGNTDEAGSREGGGVYIKKRKISTIRSRIRITE